MRQRRVAVCQLILKPVPSFDLIRFIERQQALCQFLLNLTYATVTRKAFQILVDPDQCKRPGTWAGRFEDRKQRLLEYLGSHVMERRRIRAAKHRPERPQRASMTIVGTTLFKPVVLVIHEVAEASRF